MEFSNASRGGSDVDLDFMKSQGKIILNRCQFCNILANSPDYYDSLAEQKIIQNTTMLVTFRNTASNGFRGPGTSVISPCLTTSVRWNSNRRSQFLPFEEAREHVRKLGLTSCTEWKLYSKTDRPYFIPSRPCNVYRTDGWKHYGDWMGYEMGHHFLPFDEARAYVRKLGLTSSDEWHLYCKNERPSFIPATPYRIYKTGGYIDLPDWCGYEPKLPLGRQQFLEWAQGEVVEKPVEKFDAVEWLENRLSADVPSLESFRFAPEAQGSLLLRFNDGTTTTANENPWIRVHVRSSNERDPPRGRWTFTTAENAINDGIVCIKRVDESIYFIPGSDINTKHIRISDTSKYAANRIESSAMMEQVVRKWYSEFPRKPAKEWIQEEAVGIAGKISGMGLLSQAEDLFNRCDLKMKFLPRSADATLRLGNYNILLRTLIAKRTGFGYEIQLNLFQKLEGRSGRKYFPIRLDSQIDSVLTVYHENQVVQGFFLFPKYFLREHFCTDDFPGKSCVSIYPPASKPQFRLTKERQQRQCKYYVDVSDPENLALAEAKVRSILVEIDEFKKFGKKSEEAPLLKSSAANI